MLDFVRKLLGMKGASAAAPPPSAAPPRPAPLPYRLILTEACVDAIAEGLGETLTMDHEGVVYLLGRTDGVTTLAVAAVKPTAKTTRGSFHVGAVAMARVIRSAGDLGLQVVGQVHSHPGEAFHSGGDVEGARIRYAGYVSVVVPEYGCRLPSLEGASVYVCTDEGHGFADLLGRVTVAPALLL